jgi:hypothetical protein
MPEMPLMAVLPLSRAVPEVKAIRDVRTPIPDRRTPVAVQTAIKRFVENALPAATSQSRNLLDNVKNFELTTLQSNRRARPGASSEGHQIAGKLGSAARLRG